jgi:hypothetical protein
LLAVVSSLLSLRDDRLRIVAEPRLGFSHPRSAEVRSSCAEIVVFVDEDNYLSDSYGTRRLG